MSLALTVRQNLARNMRKRRGYADGLSERYFKEDRVKAAPNLPNRSIKRQAKKASADLKIRFLELQRLRLMVRLSGL